MKLLGRMFSRQWFLTTLFVFAGAALCVRLGIWQLDRLQQRRAFNAHYLQVRSEPPLDLNTAQLGDLTGFEYRDASARGHYDFEHQVALRNQYNGDQYGYHLLTPLLLSDQTAVLVDRGWIPPDGNTDPAAWRRYDGPGDVNVSGMIRLGQTRPPFGGAADPVLAAGQTRLDLWNFVNLDRISKQVPYRLLPVYLQQAPDPSNSNPPIPYQPEVEISEGPHLGYAGQWFTFAALLFFGYPLFYLRKQKG
jgi:surfeit locus 1 family protein